MVTIWLPQFQATHVLSRQEEGGQWSKNILFFLKFIRLLRGPPAAFLFLFFIDQTLVTWSHLAIRNVGKVSGLQTSGMGGPGGKKPEWLMGEPTYGVPTPFNRCGHWCTAGMINFPSVTY